MLRAIAKLIRVEHSVMLVLGVITVILLLDLQFTPMQFVFLSLCPFLISAGAFALNDYFDVESDRKNKKDRPIVKGEITKEGALWLSMVCFALGVLATLPLGPYPLVIALIFTLLSIAYNWKLKDVAIVGNAIIASSMAIVFMFTSIALTGTIPRLIILISATSFLSGLGREIQKTVQDVEGDVTARKSKTLPVIIGKPNSLHLALMLTGLASILALYLYVDVPPLKNNILYIIPAVLSIWLLTYSSYLFYGDKKSAELGRKLSLYALMLGILAYLMGGI